MRLKAHFSRFLEANPGRLHFAAHSHHLWPDATLAAQQRCWADAARLADAKWAHVFDRVYPAAQRHVAGVLGLSRPQDVAFGPNTHGFVLRLLSCLPPGRPVRVLTSDGEFHSLSRQLRRLEEDGLACVTRVAVAPFASFPDRFAEAAGREHDLIYVSHVFYESGYAVPDLAALVEAVAAPEAFVVVDGYHGFLALPTRLRAIEDRAFYLAGGYKYAMAGEGTAFLHAPPDRAPRPRDTGWYAAFGALETGEGDQVTYAPGAARFLGATFDPVGIYRLNAVMDWMAETGLTVEAIHAHAHALQERFVAGLARLGLEALHPGRLVVPVSEPNRGNFLAFRTGAAGDIHRALGARNVVTDFRGDCLRVGFGVYQDADDVDRLLGVLGEALA